MPLYIESGSKGMWFASRKDVIQLPCMEAMFTFLLSWMQKLLCPLLCVHLYLQQALECIPLVTWELSKFPETVLSKRLTTSDREPSLLVEYVILGSNTWLFQADSMSVPHLKSIWMGTVSIPTGTSWVLWVREHFGNAEGLSQNTVILDSSCWGHTYLF